MSDVDAILKDLRNQQREAEAEVKEFNTMIVKLELMGTSQTSLSTIRAERKVKEQNVARIRRMIDAAIPVEEEAPSKPIAFVQKSVATTRSELFEVQQRIKELRAAGKIKGRKSRLPLDECYDLIRTSPRTRQVVADQFWVGIDKSEAHGDCWLAREEFKRSAGKNSLVKALYIPCLGTKVPAVRLCSLLIGLELDEDSNLNNTCGNSQCVKPAHFRAGRERTKKKQKISRSMPMVPDPMPPLGDMEDYQQYILELLMDQREDGRVNEGIPFRVAEQILVADREEIPNKDAMIKSVRLEKAKTNRFYLSDTGRLFLSGFPRRTGIPVVLTNQQMMCPE